MQHFGKNTSSHILAALQGAKGLFKGLVPRILLGIWQTLFMVTGAKLVQEAIADYSKAAK